MDYILIKGLKYIDGSWFVPVIKELLLFLSYPLCGGELILLKSDKKLETKTKINHLSIEIKTYYRNEKKFKVRQGIKPGNNKTLWEAVKIAKDQNIADLPDQMNQDGRDIINYSWLNGSFDSFKVKCKQLLL